MNKDNDLLYLIEALPQFKKFKEDIFSKTLEYQKNTDLILVQENIRLGIMKLMHLNMHLCVYQ